MKKTNNKGFSLVELIIVIAIMAVLIGILAPQYMKYVKKSKISTDITNAEELATAINVAISDSDKTIKITSGSDFAGKAAVIEENSVTTVSAPEAKTTKDDKWNVTFDTTKGVTQIKLGGSVIYPDSSAFETAKK